MPRRSRIDKGNGNQRKRAATKKQRQSRSRSCRGNNGDPVANANNSPPRSRRQFVEHQNEQENYEQPEQQIADEDSLNTQQSEDENMEAEAEASFREGDQLVQMAIQADEDNFTDDAESDVNDDEVILQSQSTQHSDNSEVVDDAEGQCRVAPTNRNKNENNAVTQGIQRIDDEMKQKLQELHSLMMQGGLTESVKVLDKCSLTLLGPKNRGNRESTQNKNPIEKDLVPVDPNPTRSLVTIYDNAVPKRTSSSLEEGDVNLNSSDEAMPLDIGKEIEVFIADSRCHAESRQQSRLARLDEQPSTSAGRNEFSVQQITPEKRMQDMVRQAEAAKARIFATPGMSNSAAIDESYIVVGAHLDSNTIEKISKGEYVDFSKLLPRDRIASADEECKLELVFKNGKAFWTPASHTVTINNFLKWEQAFRVYSNIYCKTNPSRAPELIEYNHIIHTISLAYVWDNVYNYDKEFRLHMARNPQRSWAIILQQAWSLRLRDRLGLVGNQSHHIPGLVQDHSPRGKVAEPCRRFNRGKCNYGTACKYEHRCLYCYKFGHSNLNCRKAMSDRSSRKDWVRNEGPNQSRGNANHANLDKPRK